MINFIKKYKHAWVMSYFYIYLSWFFFLEKKVTSGYHIIHVKLDDLVPFNEYFIIPYVIWYLYVLTAVVYFFFTSTQDYYRLSAFLIAGMTISLLVCTVFPNGTDLRPVVDPDKNICTWIVSILHAVDTNTNVFPSIHAFNSLGVHLAIINSPRLKKRVLLQWCSFILMVAICLSTMFLKQHSAIDVAGSMLMAYLIYPFVYPGSIDPDRKPVRQRQNAAG